MGDKLNELWKDYSEMEIIRRDNIGYRIRKEWLGLSCSGSKSTDGS